MSDLWRCPKCGAILRKGNPELAQMVMGGGLLVGTATCGVCGAQFSQRDVYRGLYDHDPYARQAARGDKRWWQFWK